MDECKRCGDTPTYKKCASCGKMFEVDRDYQSYKLPTQDISDATKHNFKTHWHRFKYYDLCEDCLTLLRNKMNEVLNG